MGVQWAGRQGGGEAGGRGLKAKKRIDMHTDIYRHTHGQRGCVLPGHSNRLDDAPQAAFAPAMRLPWSPVRMRFSSVVFPLSNQTGKEASKGVTATALRTCRLSHPIIKKTRRVLRIHCTAVLLNPSDAADEMRRLITESTHQIINT